MSNQFSMGSIAFREWGRKPRNFRPRTATALGFYMGLCMCQSKSASVSHPLSTTVVKVDYYFRRTISRS